MGEGEKVLVNVNRESLSIKCLITKKTVIPASKTRREFFFQTIRKIPDKPE